MGGGLFWTRKGLWQLLWEDGNVPYLGTGVGNTGRHFRVHEVVYICISSPEYIYIQ